MGALRATPKGPCVAGARERGADARGEGCRAERGGAQERGGGGCAAPTSTPHQREDPVREGEAAVWTSESLGNHEANFLHSRI